MLPQGDIASSVLPGWILGPIFFLSLVVSLVMGKHVVDW